MTDLVKDGECLDDLQLNGLKIIQKLKGFRFGIDAVLLSNYVKVDKNMNIMNLGTGTGIIPILLSAKPTRIILQAWKYSLKWLKWPKEA